MQFLERCFELPKTCFKNSSKEKVWTKFHMAMKDQDNLRSLDEMVTSAVSPWLCFEALNIMISTVFDKFFKTEIKYTEKGNQSLNDIEKNITHYIGGAVLQKIKKKTYRLKDQEEKQEILTILESLSANSSESTLSLTSLLDRGGLVTLHPNIELLFAELEMTFRAMFSGFSSSAISFEAYLQECSISTVSKKFYDHLYSVCTQENKKEKVLKDVIYIYFKIRARHKCKTFMDDFYRLSKKEKREKGTRKRLKQAHKI